MHKFSHQVSLTAFYKVSIMDANNGNKKISIMNDKKKKKKTKKNKKKQNKNKNRSNGKSCT